MFEGQTWQIVISQFHFLRPMWLFAFIPMGLLIGLRWREDNRPNWKDILPLHLRQALTIGELGWRKQLPLKLLIVVTTIAIIICAGLSWKRQASPFGEDKASMLVILDNTQSMLQTDLPPSRLDRAKQKIRDLLAQRKGGKTGLVVFAGSAHLAMPITQDNQVFMPFLAAITPEIMPVEGKQAERAFALIDSQLRQELGSTVLLITDGVNQATIDAYEAFFADKPYQLLIFAMGNSDVVSDVPIDMASLKALVNATGGRLVEVTVDNADIDTLNRYIERNMQLNGESSMPWEDMGYGLLIPMAIVMLLWFRKGWLVQWCIMVTLSLNLVMPWQVMAETVSTKAASVEKVEPLTLWDKTMQRWWDLWLTPDQQGQRLFNQNQYLEAAKHFTDPLRKGTAYYYAREYKLAQSAFIQMENDHGLYNAASALARQREYVKARNLLSSLLKKETLSPSLRADVEHNLAVISGIVEEVNRTSESQSSSSDGPEESLELDESQPQTGDGADEETVEALMVKETLTAKQMLADQDLADKWLKRVEADPKYFLKAKFQGELLNASDMSHTQEGEN